MVLSEKLATLNTAKQNIKSALTSKGQDMSTTHFTEYGDTINNLNTTQLFDYCDCYISPTGSDSNTGTKSSPFKTVTYALNKYYRIIGLINGTYTTLTDLFKQYGNYILIGGDNVIIDGLNTSSGFYFTQENVTYINLTFKNFKDYFFYGDTSNTSYPSIINCIWCTFIKSTSTTYFISNNSYYLFLNFLYCDIINVTEVTGSNPFFIYLNYCYHSNITSTKITETNRVSSKNFPNRISE